MDLFDDDFEINSAAARILGRHLQSVLQKSTLLKTRVIEILEEQTASIDQPGILLKKFASDRNKSILSVKELLDNILKGIND